MRQQNRMQQWIAAGFLELADEMPLGKITVKRICDLLNINRSTFYYHFNSIQDLIHWIYHNEVNEPVLKKIRSDPENLQQISIIALSRIYEKREFWQRVLRLNTRDEFVAFMLRDTKENWKQVIQTVLSNQHITRESLTQLQQLRLDYITEYYCSAHYHVTLMWVEQGMQIPPDQLASIIDMIATNGFFGAVTSVLSEQ